MPLRTATDAASGGSKRKVIVPLGTLDGVEPDGEDRYRRMLEIRLRDPEVRAECERLYTDMLERLAPATEGPVAFPGRKRRGRLIFGDNISRTL